MSLLWKIPIGIVSALLLVIAAVTVAFALGVIERPSIAIEDSSWGNVTRQQTEIRTDVQVTNPNEFGVTLDEVALGVVVDFNDIRVARGTTQQLPMPPGRSTTTVVTIIDNTTIPEWWASHVKNGEHTEVAIKPLVRSAAIGRRWVVDILEETREFDTHLLAQASTDQPQTFSAGAYSLTVQSRTFEWAEVSGETVSIDGTVVLSQDSPITLRADSLEFTLIMNDIPVAQGNVNGPIEVPPGIDTPLAATAELSNERLLDWWPTHIQAGEETRYRIEATVSVNTPAGTASATVLDAEDRFETALLEALQEQIGSP